MRNMGSETYLKVTVPRLALNVKYIHNVLIHG